MKKGRTFLFSAITLFALAGCGQKQEQEVNWEIENQTTQEVAKETESTTETAQTEPVTSTTATDTESIAWDGYEDNFAVESETAAAYAKLIKEAVAEKNIEKLADLTSFPVYVGLSKENPVIYTREEFVAIDVELLFSEEMVNSIAGADENGLNPSRAGFNLYGSNGAPSITFGVSNGKLGISGINY